MTAIILLGVPCDGLDAQRVYAAVSGHVTLTGFLNAAIGRGDPIGEPPILDPLDEWQTCSEDALQIAHVYN